MELLHAIGVISLVIMLPALYGGMIHLGYELIKNSRK